MVAKTTAKRSLFVHRVQRMQRVELNALFGPKEKVADEWNCVEGSRTPLHICESGGDPAKLVRFPLAKK